MARAGASYSMFNTSGRGGSLRDDASVESHAQQVSFSGVDAAATGLDQSGIGTIIAEKERELSEMNSLRFRSLEKLLTQKESEVGKLSGKLERLKEDYEYNLKAFQERDELIESLQAKLGDASAALQQRDVELGECRASLAEARARGDSESSRVRDLEAFYTSQLKELREGIEAARRARDDESKRWRADIDAVRGEAEARLRARDAEFESARESMAETADAALSAARRDAKRREDELSSALKEARDRSAAAARDAEEGKRASSSLAAALEATRAALRTAETDAAECRAALEGMRAEGDASLRGMARERDEAIASSQALIRTYEGRMQEMLTSLRTVESAFKSQREEYEARLSGVARESSDAAAEYTAVMDARLQALLLKLSDAESVAAAARASSGDATARAEQAEARAREQEARAEASERDAANARADAAAAAARHAGVLAASQGRVTELQAHADAIGAALAVARADAAAASARAADAEAREAASRETHEREMKALHDARDSLMGRLEGSGVAMSARAATLGLSSAGLTGGDAAPAGVSDARAHSLLEALRSMEAALRAAREETAAAQAEVARLHASPPDMHLASEGLRAAAVEAENVRLRSVIADMRAHMETLGSAAAPAVAPVGDEAYSIVCLERDDLAREVGRLRAYVDLLQARVDGAYTPGSGTADAHAECRLLRAHNRELSEDAAALRAALRARSHSSGHRDELPSFISRNDGAAQTEAAPVTRHRTHSNAASSHASGGGDTATVRELAAAHAQVTHLLAERDKLLDLSNQLRADLNRSAHYSDSGRGAPPEPAPRQRAQEPPHVEYVHAAPVAAGTSRMGQLESALVALSEQNAALTREMRALSARTQVRERTPASHTEEADADGYAAARVRGSLEPAPPLHAPSRSVAVARPTRIPAAPTHADEDAGRRSPSRARLDAERARMGTLRTAVMPSRGSSWSPVSLVVPYTGVDESPPREAPRYSSAASRLATAKARMGVEARTPPRRRPSVTGATPSTGTHRGAAAQDAMAATDASIGAAAAAAARVKAQAAAATGARVRNYNDMR